MDQNEIVNVLLELPKARLVLLVMGMADLIAGIPTAPPEIVKSIPRDIGLVLATCVIGLTFAEEEVRKAGAAAADALVKASVK